MMSLYNFFANAFHRDGTSKNGSEDPLKPHTQAMPSGMNASTQARRQEGSNAELVTEVRTEVRQVSDTTASTIPTDTPTPSAMAAHARLKRELQQEVQVLRAFNEVQDPYVHTPSPAHASAKTMDTENQLIHQYSPLKQYVGIEVIETYTPTQYASAVEENSRDALTSRDRHAQGLKHTSATVLLTPEEAPTDKSTSQAMTQVHKSFWEGCLYQVSPNIHIVTYHSHMAGQRYTHTLKMAAGILNMVKMGEDQVRQTFQMNDWHATQHFFEGRSLVLRHFTHRLTLNFQPTQDCFSPAQNKTSDTLGGALGYIYLTYDLWSGNHVLGRYEKSWRFFG